MAELTEAVAEVAESVAEDALTVANISRSISGRDMGIGFILGGSLGSLLSFWLVRRNLEAKYTELAEEEISEMREHFRAKQIVADEKPDLEAIVEERGYVPPPPGGLNVVQTAADMRSEIEDAARYEPKQDAEEDWNYEAELALRSPDKPYVIHQDEFSDPGYTGVTLMYYEGDDILCDEHNKPIDNKDQLVGEDNLGKFGHGSGNPNILYVRNELLSIDIEVVKDEGSFVEKMHGLKHSAHYKRRRFDKET